MNDEMNDFENELMKEEDALMEEMKVEFQQRLKTRIQNKIKAREKAMPEVQRLKKNAASSESCVPPSER
jgi:hypothetical protein